MNSHITPGMALEKAVNPHCESDIECQWPYLQKQLWEDATQHRLDGLYA